jgi:hypothetical protein
MTTLVTKMLTMKKLHSTMPILTMVFEGRASDERGTLRMQRLWMNFFFTILAVVRLKR